MHPAVTRAEEALQLLQSVRVGQSSIQKGYKL